MEFKDCISFLEKRFTQPLPGQDAQFKLAPSFRPRPSLNELEKINSYKKSAVLILLFPLSNEPHIVFIKRTERGIHGGQISFPGGRTEENETPYQTAVRESEEEVGIVQKDIKFLGELTWLYIPPSNFLVYPFVAYTEQQPEFIINPDEAEIHIELPLESFFSEENIEVGEFTSSVKGRFSAPHFNINGNKIWGATSMMMSELVAMFAGRNSYS